MPANPAEPVQTPTPVTQQTSAAQATQQQNATSAAPAVPMMFVRPMTISQPMRLAMTPRIDGRIENEEWDPFNTVDGVDTYFQWEPNKIHIAAAHVPMGQDLVISIDGHGDGWLVGKDNVEVRVHWNNNNPEITERILDNTPVSGPVWVDAPNFKSTTLVAGSSDDKGRTVEMTITDPNTDVFPDQPDHTVSLRIDPIPETTPSADPLYPRVLVPTRVTYARGADLPAGLTWRPEVNKRTVVPGENGRIRLGFNGNDDLGLKRIEMRTEGLGQNETISTGVPFPSFDKKGRAIVDYKTSITRDADMGYRVMRATVFDGSGKAATLETCYQISSIVSFDFHDKLVVGSSEPKIVKFSCLITSNTTNRVDGVFRVQAPEGWKIKSGNDRPFLIYDSRSSKRQVFEIQIPGGYKGTAPIRLIADFAGKHSEETEYIVVQ
jgi:hypothetical protein